MTIVSCFMKMCSRYRNATYEIYVAPFLAILKYLIVLSTTCSFLKQSLSRKIVHVLSGILFMSSWPFFRYFFIHLDYFLSQHILFFDMFLLIWMKCFFPSVRRRQRGILLLLFLSWIALGFLPTASAFLPMKL